MDYIEKLEASIKAKVDNRVARLEEEIETLQKSQRADESYYGFGGPYRRREKAMDKRKQEIREMQEFVRQTCVPVMTNEVSIFLYNSR